MAEVSLLGTHSAHAPLGDPWETVTGRAMAGMGTCRLSRAHCCLVIIYQMMENWTVLWSCSKCSLGCGNRGHSSSHGTDLARQTVMQNVDVCRGGAQCHQDKAHCGLWNSGDIILGVKTLFGVSSDEPTSWCVPESLGKVGHDEMPGERRPHEQHDVSF